MYKHKEYDTLDGKDIESVVFDKYGRVSLFADGKRIIVPDRIVLAVLSCFRFITCRKIKHMHIDRIVSMIETSGEVVDYEI